MAQAWAKSVDAAGGIQGHPVTIIFKDDGSNPDTSVTDAQALIASKVDVILDLDTLDSTWVNSGFVASMPRLADGVHDMPTRDGERVQLPGSGGRPAARNGWQTAYR